MLYFLKSNWVRILIGFIIGLSMYLTIVGVNNGWNKRLLQSDALFITGGALFAIGGLVWVSNMGGFNIFSYQVGRKRMTNGMKENLTEYTQRKQEERKKYRLTFLSYFIVGTPFIIASIILGSSL